MAHLALQVVENFSLLYLKLIHFVLWLRPITRSTRGLATPTPTSAFYAQFTQLQREFQLDVAEPINNAARVSTGAFTNSLDKRREKIIIRIRKSNAKAASAIARIPPFS